MSDPIDPVEAFVARVMQRGGLPHYPGSHFDALETELAIYRQARAAVPEPRATDVLTSEQIAREVHDKIGVVFHGCAGSPFQRDYVRRQCEVFLVDLYNTLRAERDQAVSQYDLVVTHVATLQRLYDEAVADEQQTVTELSALKAEPVGLRQRHLNSDQLGSAAWWLTQTEDWQRKYHAMKADRLALLDALEAMVISEHCACVPEVGVTQHAPKFHSVLNMLAQGGRCIILFDNDRSVKVKWLSPVTPEAP